MFYPQASSQWDALGHVFYQPERYYNDVTHSGVVDEGRNTIDHWAQRGVAGRAVLLDLERTLAAWGDYDPFVSRSFTIGDLEAARE